MTTLPKISILLFFLSVFVFSCKKPEDAFVGTWEYHSYKASDSGLGALAGFIPEEWKSTVDTWIDDGKKLTNSIIIFRPDGTYEEHFRGAPDRITSVQGYYSVSSDLSKLNLKTAKTEYIFPIVEITDTSFIYEKSFDEYKLPLTLEVKYKRLK
ncbi:MAG: hypothetical protein R3277_01270 [Brumimicrobium sp.]|nr:hypothetical protein [Brumimicrobium sp.]